MAWLGPCRCEHIGDVHRNASPCHGRSSSDLRSSGGAVVRPIGATDSAEFVVPHGVGATSLTVLLARHRAFMESSFDAVGPFRDLIGGKAIILIFID